MTNTNIHYQGLKQWGIIDKRFNLATIYMVHSYKFKQIHIALEKIVSILNNYNDPKYYEGGRIKIFDEIYKIIIEILKQLYKRKNIIAIESIIIEIIGKLMIYVASVLSEMVVHPDFKCTKEQQRAWLNGLYDLNGKFDVLYIKASKICPISKEVFFKSIHLNWIKQKLTATSNYFYNNLISNFEIKAEKAFKSLKIAKLDFNTIFKELITGDTEDNLLVSDVMQILRKKQLNKTLAILLLYLSNQDVDEILKHIEQLCNKPSELCNSLNNIDCEDEITFIEQLKIFYTSTNKIKIEAALSCIKELLIYKPTKKVLIMLIEHRFEKNQNQITYFAQIINEHFTGSKRMIEIQQKRKTAIHKLHVVLICTLFCVKIKRIRLFITVHKRKSRSIHISNADEFMNPHIDYDKLYSIVDFKITYQVITPECLRTVYKNCVAADM